MSTVTKHQIQIIHTLLPEHIKQDRELKEAFVVQYTQDPDKTSTKDLTYEQAHEMMTYLTNGRHISANEYGKFDYSKAQHRYIMSLCHQLAWVVFDPKLGRNVADIERLGTWLKKYGYLHKPLKKYTTNELPRLIKQMENMLSTITVKPRA